MVKNVEELKQFILWAKEQKITRIKINDIEIDIMPLSYIDGVSPETSYDVPSLTKPPEGLSKTWDETVKELQEQDDPDLYFSVT